MLNAAKIRKPPTRRQEWSKWRHSVCLLLLIAGCADAQNSAQVTPSELPTAPAEAALTETAQNPPEPSEANQSQPATTDDERLWAKLAQADDETYVVLLRHAIAPGTGDPANFQINDCTTQRNLSEPGRQQARDIGKAFRDRNIPIAKVLSSQWCRCLETAELMAVGPVEPFLALNSFFRDRTTADAQTSQVRQYINNQDQPGVIIMVTHQVNITALTSIFPSSGTAVVLQLDDRSDDGGSQLKVIGQILESDI